MSGSLPEPGHPRRSWLPVTWGPLPTFLVIGALYFLLANSAYELFGALTLGVTFFPPAGLTFAAFFALPRRLWPAIAAAIVAGVAAEWLDFRALRYPILLIMLAGVTATAYAWTGGRGGWRPFVTAVAIGVAAWAAAETLYVVLHAAQGERFDAERFGPQWRQALGLIGVHAVVLGAPTGIVAAVLLQAASR